jgi:hypothetical protein
LVGLLEALVTLRPLTIIAEEADRLADYGLDPPRRRVTIMHRGSPAQLSIALGDRNPAGTAVYARTGPGSNRVILVGAVILWEITKVTRAARPRGSALLPPASSPDYS